MNEFILVTLTDDNSRILLPLSRIVNIFVDDDGSTFVALNVDRKDRLSGFTVVESFDEIVSALNSCGLVVSSCKLKN